MPEVRNRGRQRRPGSFGSAQWQGSRQSSARRGTGVRYGKLNLSPKDRYVLASPKAHAGNLRISVLGGNEEVGRNMTMLEYGDDIILIDMGIQFAEEHMRGVDGIVQDLSYLKGREHQVRAVIITHMHMDHIGALPHLMPMLPNVPVFSTPITLALIAKKLEYTPDIKINLQPIDEQTTLGLGNFHVSFIGVSHSVPSALAVIVKTPVGIVVHTGDFKIDLNPQDEDARRYLKQMQDLGKENVLALLSDSTNASVSGRQVMEHEVINDLDMLLREAKGRLLFGMISTNVVRLGQIIMLAEKYGRHVAIGGKSLKTTLEIAENLGYIQPKKGTIIDIEDVKTFSPGKAIAIFPGAQGETNAAFYKLANNELRELQIVPGDTVVFSSSVIPGNERTVQFITDAFYRRGAKVINYRALNIHAGGHAKAEDLGEVVKIINPKYLVPIEGNHAFLHHHALAAMAVGFPRERIFIADNGQVMEFDKNRNGVLTKEKIPLLPIFIDGKTLAAVDADTLRDRKQIGDEGIIIINGRLVKGTLQDLHIKSLGVRKAAFVKKLHGDIEKALASELRSIRAGKGEDVGRLLEKRLSNLIFLKSGTEPCVVIHLQQ